MSTQTTISQFFSERKRHVDEIKVVNQDSKTLSSGLIKSVSKDATISDESRLVLKRKISWEDEVPRKKIVTASHHNPKRTPQFTTLRTSIKKSRVKSAEKSSARKNLFNVPKKKLNFDKPVDSSVQENQAELTVVDKVKEGVSLEASDQVVPSQDVQESIKIENIDAPVDHNEKTDQSVDLNEKTEEPSDLNEKIEEPSDLNDKIEEPADRSDRTEKQSLDQSKENVSFQKPSVFEAKPSTSKLSSREELGLGELKSKLKGSSRLNKIRDAIKNFNKGYDKLSETRAKLDNVPRLKEFDTIEIEVPASPVKSFKWDAPSPSKFTSPSKLREAAFRSPAKPSLPTSKLPYVSPRKLLEEMRPRDSSSSKTDYYARCSVQAAQEGRPFLPLPHSYRILAELFKSMEVVMSMIHARKEQAYFSKVKPSTQELCKKTLSEHHLGQMLRIFPNAFRLSYEKVKVHGKSDKYELTIHPVHSNEAESSGAPTTTLERQRYFYKHLLDLVKTHHEKYLLSQDPPLKVDKEKLTRWHPGFDVDSCPDIEPVEIPQPPHVETYTSARQLFGKAKELFMANPRMEKALDKLPKTDNVLSNGKPSAASSIPGLANALKGIPKSLLEKVRAKQAAKAVEMLTRDPQIAKQEIEISRLPEMARILRYLFVVERRNVMAKSRILDKLSSSFRENLSASEMDRHLMLLVEKTGTWLKIHRDHNVTFITMNKSMEMNNVYNAINATS